jgi:hypothetical protein
VIGERWGESAADRAALDRWITREPDWVEDDEEDEDEEPDGWDDPRQRDIETYREPHEQDYYDEEGGR